MDMPIQVPMYMIILGLTYVLAYSSINATKKFDKILSLILLIFWCFSAGWITYANMLQGLTKY